MNERNELEIYNPAYGSIENSPEDSLLPHRTLNGERQPDDSNVESNLNATEQNIHLHVDGPILSCHDVCYSVNVPKPGRCNYERVTKPILHGINGVFKPGINAIMGPTGGGKTTILNILSGRNKTGRLTGNILLDGCTLPKNFKCMSGYVVQDDVVMDTLTVRENIMFSANLRLSKYIPAEKKRERVEDIIVELGLTKCADTRVGNELIRGISGGERKRTNIGAELIVKPSILFLDEPTTGLDASKSESVIALLQALSRRGRTIIFSIHQPRYSIFKLFDRMTLVAAGRTVYHGSAFEALEYFKLQGYECEEHNNPADFFLDVVNGECTPSTEIPITNILMGENTKCNGAVISTKAVADDLCQKYQNSTWHKKLMEELQSIASSFEDSRRNGTSVPANEGEYANNVLVQMKHISIRNLLNISRNPLVWLLQMTIALLWSLLIGVVFFRLADDVETGIQNRVGVLFYITMNQVFQNASAIDVFIRSRRMFVHEATNGYYRVSAFFFGKMFCDLIPMRIIPLTLFAIISYSLTGLQPYVYNFFIYYLALIMTALCGSVLALVIGATVRNTSSAIEVFSLIIYTMLTTSGFLMNIPAMRPWISWLAYFSIQRYCLNILTVNELNDIVLVYYNSTGYPIGRDTEIGPDYLTSQGIKHDTAWDLWQNIVALAIMYIVLLFLAYIQLRRLKTASR